MHFQPLLLWCYSVHPNNTWKSTKVTSTCKRLFPGSERWCRLPGSGLRYIYHQIDMRKSDGVASCHGNNFLWGMELLRSCLGNGERFLVLLVLNVASSHEASFYPCILSQEQVRVQISVCLKGMWLSCSHVSFFSHFLACLVSPFRGNRKAVMPQGLSPALLPTGGPCTWR